MKNLIQHLINFAYVAGVIALLYWVFSLIVSSIAPNILGAASAVSVVVGAVKATLIRGAVA